MIGTILKNTETEKKIGCIVHYNPVAHQAVIFRATSPDHPSFGRINLATVGPSVQADGNINDYNHGDIKQYLLRYLRTRNLSPTEERVMAQIKDYAFPNGLPKYDSSTSSTDIEGERQGMNLDKAARPGYCLYINTPAISPFQHLDNHKVYVISRDDQGLWVCTIDNSSPITSYLPFKHRPTSGAQGGSLTCHGISRLMPLDESPPQSRLDELSQLDQDAVSQIIVKGTRVKVLPKDNNRVIIPSTSEYKGKYYDYRLGDLVTDPPSNGIGSGSAAIGIVGATGVAHGSATLGAGNIASMFDNEAPIRSQHNTSSGDIGDGSGSLTTSSGDYNSNSNGPMLVVDENGETDDGLLDILDGMEANEHMDTNTSANSVSESDDEDGDDDENGDGNVLSVGGNRKKKNSRKQKGGVSSDSGLDSDAEDDVLDSEIKAIMNEDAGLRKSVRSVEESGDSGKDGSSISGLSDSEPELEFVDDDEEIEELGVFQKIRQKAVPETDKVYKESIQRGRLLKQKLEKIPAVLRENPYWLNRVRKEVNTISLIKALGTVVDKSRIDETGSRVVLRTPEFKPLVEKMMNRDFTNQLLIPLVAARKRIYLTPSDTIGVSEFDPDNTEVITDTFDHLAKQELLVKTAPGGGVVRRQVNIDNELNRIQAENTPELPHNNTMGLLFRLGEGIRPEDGINQPFGTTKLQGQRATERQAVINQNTTVVRYGAGDAGMNIQNYGIEQSAFDTFVAMGPMSRYVNEEHTRLTLAEIEAMEDQVDRNMEVNSSRYKVYYHGDNMSLIGFIRPPLVTKSGNSEVLTGVPDSLKTRLNEAEKDSNVLIRRIGKRYVDRNDTELDVMENPTKFIMYIIPMDGKVNLDDSLLRRQLTKIIPDVSSYIKVMSSKYRPKTPEDISSIVAALGKLEYFYPNNNEAVKMLAASTSKFIGSLGNVVPPHPAKEPLAINYDDYESLREVEEEVAKRMKSLSDKLDRMIKLGKYRHRKIKEKKSINSGNGSDTEARKARKNIVIPDDLVEIANKIYGEQGQYNLDLSVPMATAEEITRLEFYSRQHDNGQYMNMLIHLTALERLDSELDKAALELELQGLKDKFDAEAGSAGMADRVNALKPALRDKLQACRRRIDRKPKIMKYPSVERLESDNGHVITNAKGEVIQSGDYALIVNGAADGQHLIYKREQLATGDYWLSQPINALEDLLKKKKDSCTDSNGDKLSDASGTNGSGVDSKASKKDMLELPDERCLFDISKVECMPDEIATMDNNMAGLESQIADVKGKLDMALAVPVIIKEVKQAMKRYEQQIGAVVGGKKALRQHEANKNKELAQALVAMRNKKQDCLHFRATEYLDSLKNITVTERYHLVQKILDIYADQAQMAALTLDDVAGDPEHNYIRCHVCSQNLMCKHNLYAISMLQATTDMEDNADQIDDELMADKYGHVVGGSIYCRICGYFLSNTAVQDIEEYEKRAGKEGLHNKTREVIETRNVVEQQRDAIARIMREAIETETTGDMKFQLRIYRLVKNLSGLDMLSVEDELDMVNFIKSANFIPKKVFYTRLYVMFMRLKKQAPPAILDKLSSNQYWLHVTADIMCRFLVTLQASRQTYQVYNSLCVNNIIGWPLLRDSRDQPAGRSGLEFMQCLAKQMVLSPGGEYAYLNPVDKFIAILERRMDDLISGDAYVRDKLEQALDDKYQQITFMDEMATAPATQWLTYQPPMTFWVGGVKWQPVGGQPPSARDLVKDWQPGTVDRVRAVIIDNIAYQTQLLSSDLAKVVGESEPTTRFTLTSSIGNGCCPIDVHQERERTGVGRYGNPRLSYYALPKRHIPEISNHIRKIAGYEEAIAALQRALYATRYRLLSSRPNAIHNWYKVPPLDLSSVSPDIVREYFMTYVDSPSKQTSHGRAHLFDPFGRCLISNQLKQDLQSVNYTEDDFRRLSRVVSERNIVFRQSLDESGIHIGGQGIQYEASCVLATYVAIIDRLITLTQKQPKTVPRLDCPHLEKINRHIKEALQSQIISTMAVNPIMYSSIEMIIRELSVVADVLERLHTDASNSISAAGKWRVMWDMMTKICHLLCARFEEATIRHMNVAIFPKDMRLKDTQRRYFDLISAMDTQIQNQIDSLVDIIGQNQKDESELENVLVDIGDLKEIRADYDTYLDKQLDIIPRIGGAYLNKSVLVAKRGSYNRVRFITKMVKDLAHVAHILSNRAWSGLKSESEIVAKYSNITDFFQFKDNYKLISRLAPLSKQVSMVIAKLSESVYPLPQLIQTEPGILQPELLSGISHYSLLWMLNQYMDTISGEGSKKVNTLSTASSSDSADSSKDSIMEGVKDLADSREETTGPTPEELAAMDGMSEDDLDLYPELIVEGRDVDTTGFTADADDDESKDNDSDSDNSNTMNNGKSGQKGSGSKKAKASSSHNFHQKLVETRDTNKNIMISYIRDCIMFLADNHKLAGDLNMDMIAKQIAKTREQQIRRNLRVFKFLNEEGREDDYHAIKEMMRIGRLKYADLADYTQANFPGGDDGDPEDTGMFTGEEDDREAKNYNIDPHETDDNDMDNGIADSEAEAKRDRLGFSIHEHEEMGYVGEAEDMEGGDFDYGYVGVD